MHVILILLTNKHTVSRTDQKQYTPTTESYKPN